MWNVSTKPELTTSTVNFTRGVAPVTLPEGARIREFSCFGSFDPANNRNKKIRLRRLDLASSHVGEVIADVKVRPGSGVRRLDTVLNHTVDNFHNLYQVSVVFNTPPSIRGCRIGYVPPATI